jgi:FHA domain
MSETWLLAAQGLVLLLLFGFVWAVARSASRGLGELDLVAQATPTSIETPSVRVIPQAPPTVAPVAPLPPPPAATDTRPQPVIPGVAPAGGEAPTVAAEAPRPTDTSAFGLNENIRPRLIVDASTSLTVGLEVELEGGVTIGRSRSSQLCMDDSFVSHMHARIFRRGPFYFIEDLGSTNGTYINGRRVEDQGQLKVHDELRMGETVLRYEE